MERSIEEAEALWSAVFGSARQADTHEASALFAELVANLPTLDYERFTLAGLNDAALVWPVHSFRALSTLS